LNEEWFYVISWHFLALLYHENLYAYTLLGCMGALCALNSLSNAISCFITFAMLRFWYVYYFAAEGRFPIKWYHSDDRLRWFWIWANQCSTCIGMAFFVLKHRCKSLMPYCLCAYPWNFIAIMMLSNYCLSAASTAHDDAIILYWSIMSNRIKSLGPVCKPLSRAWPRVEYHNDKCSYWLYAFYWNCWHPSNYDWFSIFLQRASIYLPFFFYWWWFGFDDIHNFIGFIVYHGTFGFLTMMHLHPLKHIFALISDCPFIKNFPIFWGRCFYLHNFFKRKLKWTEWGNNGINEIYFKWNDRMIKQLGNDRT
jgi:hypothetical protein